MSESSFGGIISFNPFFYVNGYTNIWLVSNAKEK